MKKKTIYTHVSDKALKSIINLAKIGGTTVYLHPVPYGPNFNLWTVAVTRK